MKLIDFLKNLLNPNQLQQLLISWGYLAYPLLFAIVFSETGLLIGFFLPGDSLLFIAGFVASQKVLNLAILTLLLCIAAVIGDGVGYFLGKKIGRSIYNRPDSLLFKKEHLRKTEEFYAKHGGKTIILARFVPIIRTFAPFVAGMASMSYSKFLSFNIFGGIGWVILMTGAGYLLGNIPIVRQNFEKVVLLIIFISILPVLKEIIFAYRKKS